jgi:hypothetical protein
MTSKVLVLRLLDWTFVGLTTLLVLGVAGLPMEWMLDLFDMSSVAFEAFGVFVLFASMLLIHAVATSDSATW